MGARTVCVGAHTVCGFVRAVHIRERAPGGRARASEPTRKGPTAIGCGAVEALVPMPSLSLPSLSLPSPVVPERGAGPPAVVVVVGTARV